MLYVCYRTEGSSWQRVGMSCTDFVIFLLAIFTVDFAVVVVAVVAAVVIMDVAVFVGLIVRLVVGVVIIVVVIIVGVFVVILLVECARCLSPTSSCCFHQRGCRLLAIRVLTIARDRSR